jgi:hypothetical protein
VLASEMRDGLDEKINEFGDFEVFTADALQPEWRNPVVDIAVELGDKDRFVVVTDYG